MAEQSKTSLAEIFGHVRHPLTCDGNRGDEAHKAFAAEHGLQEPGELVTDQNGKLWCPVCGYRQRSPQEVRATAYDEAFADGRAAVLAELAAQAGEGLSADEARGLPQILQMRRVVNNLDARILRR